MPPRLNKRQQREIEELTALGGPSNEEPELSGDESSAPVAKGGSGAGFAALFDPGEDEPESAEESVTPKSRKNKKKKKKVLAATGNLRRLEPTDLSPKPATPAQSDQPKNEKKALKKAKAKERKAGRDELDKALEELSIQYPELKEVQRAPGPSSKSNFESLLSISLSHLDSEAEMKRFFGAKVVAANKSTDSSSKTRRQPTVLQRSNLTRPQSAWAHLKQREGLSLRALTPVEILEKNERHGWGSSGEDEKWWTVDYSKKYRSMTMAFLKTVLSGDPEEFWNLLGKLPWHADTLLQLSEVYRHRGEHGQAVDFVDRALFTYERSFIGAFTFTSGANRLDFDFVENRPFFMAVHRQAIDLQRRGCSRTSFEFTRLLYSLDPWTDPHGALLHLDFLAIKSGMHQWLLDVYEHFANRFEKDARSENRFNPSLLPGWAYAKALALRANEGKRDHENSTVALRDAILSFPMIVPLLADKIDLSLPGEVRAHSLFRIETDAATTATSLHVIHLLSHLYSLRSFPLWKDPESASWLADTTKSVFATLSSWPAPTPLHTKCLSMFDSQELRVSIYRHTFVLESVLNLRRLFSFIPKEIVNDKSLACDPMPPGTAVTVYDEEFFRGCEDLFAYRTPTRAERAQEARMLERMIPDPAFRRMMQDFFRANPAFAERFPGGILQFAQMAGQMPEDMLENLMLAQAMQAGEDEGGMPGGMPEEDETAEINFHNMPVVIDNRYRDDGASEGDEEDHDDSEIEEEEDEESDPLPIPMNMIRNVFRRLFGLSTGANADQSESEEEVEEPHTLMDEVD